MFPNGAKVKHCLQQTYQVIFFLVTAAVTCIQNVEEERKDTYPGRGVCVCVWCVSVCVCVCV